MDQYKSLMAATKNSLYEVDAPGMRVRRLLGRAEPTPRQGPDGEWRSVVAIPEVEVGRPMVFVWAVEEVDGLTVARSTITSPVASISKGPVVG